jgi:tetratricopeptide (TPR) repeat protein
MKVNQSGNPYVIGAPLRSEQGFFGRQDILDWTMRNLHGPNVPSLVFFGQRAIGKTFLLRQLVRILPADAFLAVYFDLHGWAANPLGAVLAALAGVAAKQANLQSPGPHLFDDQGHFFRRTFLPRFQAVALEGRRRLVLLLDEFDVSDETAEAGLPAVAAVNALFPLLQDLVEDGSPMALVFATGRRADDLTLDFDTAFGSTLVQEVGCLGWESAEALVRQAETNDTLHFSDLAVSRVLDFTGGHPCWTQLLCRRIWERAYAGNPVEVPLIDALAVEEAVPDALAEGDRTLAWCWEGLSRAEKIYAATLAEMVGERETVAADRIVRTISHRAAQLCGPEVEMAPRHLVGRQVLRESEEWGRGGECGFVAEFFRLWVRRNRPLESVVGDLGRINPSGESSFEIGAEYFGKWEWEEAIRHFREALEANPSHARARRHLGEALLELGQIDDAVTELRRAHTLDASEAELSLARALAAQARVREAEMRPAQIQGARQETVDAPHDQAARVAGVASAHSSQENRILADDAESAPVSAAGAVYFDVLQWLAQVRVALGGAKYVEALRLVFPAVVLPVLSAFVFFVIGVSLARCTSGVAWLPTLFDPSTFYRFGLISAALGLVPGLRFSYEFIKHPVFNLELIYLSFSRYGSPFLVVVLVYVVLILLSWISQTSVPEEEWEGFWIFFGWIRRLWE